jgi:hypothetical protein
VVFLVGMTGKAGWEGFEPRSFPFARQGSLTSYSLIRIL